MEKRVVVNWFNRAPAPRPEVRELMPDYARPGEYDPVLRSHCRMDEGAVVLPAGLGRLLGSRRIV